MLAVKAELSSEACPDVDAAQLAPAGVMVVVGAKVVVVPGVAVVVDSAAVLVVVVVVVPGAAL